MDLRLARRRPPPQPAPPGILTRATLRAFLHGGRIGPHRDRILAHPTPEIASAVAELRSEEAARFLAQMPAARQIAIATALDPATRARLAADCDDWRCIVPILAHRAGPGDESAPDRHGVMQVLAAHQRSTVLWGDCSPFGRG